MKPTLKDKILDPAMGSAGFLLESSIYVSAHYAKELMKADNAKYYKSGMFSGFDTDQSMLNNWFATSLSRRKIIVRNDCQKELDKFVKNLFGLQIVDIILTERVFIF